MSKQNNESEDIGAAIRMGIAIGQGVELGAYAFNAIPGVMPVRNFFSEVGVGINIGRQEMRDKLSEREQRILIAREKRRAQREVVTQRVVPT